MGPPPTHCSETPQRSPGKVSSAPERRTSKQLRVFTSGAVKLFDTSQMFLPLDEGIAFASKARIVIVSGSDTWPDGRKRYITLNS